MKNRKKLNRLDKYMLREHEAAMDMAGRFCCAEANSIPCGSSPGVFISELFQSHYDMDGTGPFSEFAAKEDNGRHYTIKDDAFVQIRTKGSDIYYSLFLDAAETFAADIFADSFTGRCFILIDAADSDRICVPLSGVRLLSIERQKPHGGGTGLIIEYDEYLESGVHGRIVCGMALDRIRGALQTGSDFRQI